MATLIRLSSAFRKGTIWSQSTAIFADFYLTMPSLSARDRCPQVSDELFWVVSGVNDAVVLTEQLFTRILGDLAELIVDIINNAALIGDSHNCRFIKREFDIRQFLERTL